jgi:hypothetical protein
MPILKEAKAGMKVTELCRKQGISDAAHCNWRQLEGQIWRSDMKIVLCRQEVRISPDFSKFEFDLQRDGKR